MIKQDIGHLISQASQLIAQGDLTPLIVFVVVLVLFSMFLLAMYYILRGTLLLLATLYLSTQHTQLIQDTLIHGGNAHSHRNKSLYLITALPKAGIIKTLKGHKQLRRAIIVGDALL